MIAAFVGERKAEKTTTQSAPLKRSDKAEKRSCCCTPTGRLNCETSQLRTYPSLSALNIVSPTSSQHSARIELFGRWPAWHAPPRAWRQHAPTRMEHVEAVGTGQQ